MGGVKKVGFRDYENEWLVGYIRKEDRRNVGS